MALTGIQIFKYLPKKNCGECHFPTCLAFAMRLASAQAKLSDCPYVSDEATQFLGAASAPPIRLIKLGQGEEAVEIGDETVLFRHEKKFNHPTILAANIEDTSSREEIERKVQAVEDSEIERVGQKLRVEMLCLTSCSQDPQKYQQMVKQVAEKTKKPLILSAPDNKVIEAGLEIVAERKPLLYAATEQSIDAMASLAKSKGCPLVIKAEGLEALAALAEKAASLGVEDLVLDSGGRKAGSQLSDMTQIRRAAIKQKFKALGYPTIAWASEDTDDADLATARACIGILKYASIVVIDDVSKEVLLPLFTVRQNIFTDPQQPMQVEEKLYKIGDADENSPLLITTNFSLTYFIVLGEVEESKVPSWMLVADCEGMSVLTAWAADKFNAPKIAKLVKNNNMEGHLKHRELVIPGYVAILSGEIEEELPGWKIQVGPREAVNIPKFLRSYNVAS
ncbi:MAG: acetyl-CoA decarbonylase/synthase complex subunit gamma [bacterium]